jgi:hypothetical protein
MLSAGAYGRLVKRYPFVKAVVIAYGAMRWLLGRRRAKVSTSRVVDVELADDEVLVLTREKVTTAMRKKSTHV